MLAAALSAYGTREVVQWHRLALRARALLIDLGKGLVPLKLRAALKGKAALPDSGALVAQGVSAYDPASGARVVSVNLNLAFPSHVALVGDGDAGPRLLAALMSGQMPPSLGRLTYGGVDLAAADPVGRSGRIAFAGNTVLIEGSLKDNLLYGCVAPAGEIDHRLSEAIAIAGLDRLTHARGLSGTLDPEREPKLAADIVEARRAVQTALVAENLDRFVDPFGMERYNRYATIGENLLFGQPIGDAFQEDRLAGHPFVRAILEANELTKPLARMGLSIATSMIEIFADIPDGIAALRALLLLLRRRPALFSGSRRPQERAAAQRPDRPGPGAPDRPRPALQREPAPPRPARTRPGAADPRRPCGFRPHAAGEPEIRDRVLRRGALLRGGEPPGQPALRAHRGRSGRRARGGAGGDRAAS